MVIVFKNCDCVMNSNNSIVTSSQGQGSRPDARRSAAIVARKIANARAMMAAFGHPMKF